MLRTLAVVLALGCAAAAQAPVPVSGEHHHHFKFENEYVRVYDVEVAAHDDTLFHIHSNDYVYVNLYDVDLKAQVLDGPIVALPVKAGQCVFSKAPLTHRVLNESDKLFRNITVEILKTPGTSSSDAPSLANVPGFSKVLENDRVRIDRLVLEPGQSTGMYKDNLMNLAIAVTDCNAVFEGADQKDHPVQLKAGNYEWRPTPGAHLIKNVGDRRLEIIEIEWK